MTASPCRIPVILDTDIGGDIDDTWALAMLLKSPEFDVKLVSADTGDTATRAKIIAKMLQAAGRTDIPIAVGPPRVDRCGICQGAWVEDYSIADFPGTVHQDGVGTIIDTIMNSPEQVTLICIGPVPNIGEALQREPRIAERARFVGMHGSVRRGWKGEPKPVSECNVVHHTPHAQRVFTAPWDMTITPLDTCGIVVLQGEKYQKVRRCADPLIRALMENYKAWLAFQKRPAEDLDSKSSVLFDTVAIYLAFAQDLVSIEDLGIRVTDDGFTVIDNSAKVIHEATEWKDLAAFENLLVERLTGPITPRG